MKTLPSNNDSLEGTQAKVGLDYFIMEISGSWAIPYAVPAVGLTSRWLVTVAFIVGGVVGGVVGLYWGWYGKKAEWFIHRKLFIRAGSDPETSIPSISTIMAVYFSVLTASVILQFLFYEVICWALRKVML